MERECSCAAGAGGMCKHIGATIVYINTHTGDSKTSEPQEWGKPSAQSIRANYTGAKKISDLFPTPKREILAPVEINVSALNGIPCALREVLLLEKESESKIIAKSIINIAIIQALQISYEDKCRKAVIKVFKEQFLTISIGQNFDNLCLSDTHYTFLKDYIQKSREQLIEICVKTCLQSQCEEWHKERALRISASLKAHRIKSVKNCMASTLADNFINPKPFHGNAATKYGIKMEEIAISHYTEKNPGFVVVECGLFIKESQPWICASPDGIILENETIKKILEVKCPYICQKLPIINTDGSSNVPYLVKSLSGQFVLKESHTYYTQIQLQLYCTGLLHCDFFVFSPIESVTINIERNNDFLLKIVPKINEFYFNHFLPKLIDKHC